MSSAQPIASSSAGPLAASSTSPSTIGAIVAGSFAGSSGSS
jgi:hypothetical protein